MAESHPVTSQKKTISKIDYQVDKHTNRLENKVTGKGKRVSDRKFELNVFKDKHERLLLTKQRILN